MTLDTPIDEAQKKERELFMKLVGGDQSKAQRHIFFAEREAAKVPGIGKDVQPREIKRAAVIGAGTMGGGISMNFANVGIPVTIIENNEDALKRGMATIEKNYQTSVQRGSLKPEDMQKRLALFTPTHRPRRPEGRRHRDRGGVRGTCRSRRSCSPRSRRSPSPARCSRPTPPTSTSTRSRR